MYFKLIKEGKSDEQALFIVETKIYKGGVSVTQLAAVTGLCVIASTAVSAGGLAIASGFIVSPICYSFVGLLFTA